jgi:uracil-DNA glycosylase family 4
VQSLSDPFDPRAFESLFAFWRDSGVELAFEDEPQDRRQQLKPRLEVAAVRPVAVAAHQAPDVAEAIAAARALAAEAQTLEALQAAISAFEGCPLRYEGARRAVFSRGRADAEVMAIGEAPGADEDAQGAPFVGRAGQLLDRMLAAAGLSERVFITNTVFWRPPGNRQPSPLEQAICEPFLERAVSLVRPKVLLLLGGASAKSVLKCSEGILTLRGKWRERRFEDCALTLSALPTLHPAFLLRQPQAKKKAWADLLSLSERLDLKAEVALQTER